MDTKKPDVLCLAPCPFCGGGARRTTVGTNAWFGTGCDGDQSCPAHLRALTHKTQAEADAAWNRRAPTPASSEPVAAHTDPEGYQDGAWYWVKINGFGGDSIMAPAMYRANCGAWYSHEFIGISTRFLDVLGPCTLASDIYTAAQVQAGARDALTPAARAGLPHAFLRDVMTAAGLVSHGKQCKALGERMADEVMRLRTAEPQRFLPLTDEQIDKIMQPLTRQPYSWREFARAIERAHGITQEPQ